MMESLIENIYGRQDGSGRSRSWIKVHIVGFSGLVFDVDVGPLFSTLGGVVDLAVDCDVNVIGVLS